MAVLFEVGIVRISDADTPFLNALRKSFDDYPDGGVAADDIRDAVYWLCKAFPEIWDVPDPNDEIEEVYYKDREKKSNPFKAFAIHDSYGGRGA